MSLVRSFPGDTVLRAAGLAAVLVPAAATLAYVAAFAVNGPHFDHLTTAEIFDRWDRGQFTLEYIFRQYNEHRKALPRLVQLALGLMTRNSNRAEMFLQWALLCGAAAVLFVAFRRDVKPGWPATLAFVPVCALLLSVRQYEILLVGDGLLTYLSLFFLVTSLWLLWTNGGRAVFAGAVAAALCATFSQSNGLLVWPIGFLLLAADGRVSAERPVRSRLVVWCLAGAGAAAFYFYGYVAPEKPGLLAVLRQPVQLAGYFLAVCGTSLSADMRGAVAGGLVVLALEAIVVPMVVKDWWQARRRVPFGFWLMVCAIASIAMIALNRSWIGIGQALTPRYSTYSSLAPIGLFWCVAVRRHQWRLGQPLMGALTLLLVFGAVAGGLDGWVAGPRQRDWHRWHGYLITTLDQQARSLIEEELYPNALHAAAYVGTLKRLRLNVFKEPAVQPRPLTIVSSSVRFGLDAIDPTAPARQAIEVGADDPVILEGWASDGQSGRPAPAVFVVLDGVRDLPALAGLAVKGRGRSGFKASFSSRLLEPGEHRLSLKIVLADGIRAVHTAPVVTVRRRP
jgi:hypothetical protein